MPCRSEASIEANLELLKVTLRREKANVDMVAELGHLLLGCESVGHGRRESLGLTFGLGFRKASFT
jgi:hypothetical protein